MLSTESDKMAGWIVRSYFFGIPALLYGVSLISENDDGTKTADPDGVFEHLIYLASLYAGFTFLCIMAIVVVIGMHTNRGERFMDAFAHVLGLRSDPRASRTIKQLTKTLSGANLNPEILIENLRIANQAEREMAEYRLESRYSIAGFMSRKLHQKARTYVHSVREYAKSEEAHQAARRKAAEILGKPDSELTEALVYFSVDGALDGYALILANRYQVAGRNPLEVQDRWRNNLVGEHYSYTALFCAPAWVHETNLARGESCKDDVLVSITDAALAAGTYMDTVVNLWNTDRWHMYHKPERLVKAAKLLDRKRRGGEDHLVA